MSEQPTPAAPQQLAAQAQPLAAAAPQGPPPSAQAGPPQGGQAQPAAQPAHAQPPAPLLSAPGPAPTPQGNAPALAHSQAPPQAAQPAQPATVPQQLQPPSAQAPPQEASAQQPAQPPVQAPAVPQSAAAAPAQSQQPPTAAGSAPLPAASQQPAQGPAAGAASPRPAAAAPAPVQPPQAPQQPQQPPALEARLAALEQRLAALEAENAALRASRPPAGLPAQAPSALGGAPSGAPGTGALRVHVLRASGLEAKDESGTSDPFVKLTVSEPGGAKSVARTPTVARTLCPEWDTRLGFLNVGRGAVLLVEVFDEDEGDAHQLIGKLRLPVAGARRRASARGGMQKSCARGLGAAPATRRLSRAHLCTAAAAPHAPRRAGLGATAEPQAHELIDGELVMSACWSSEPSAVAEVGALLAARPKPPKGRTDWRVAQDASGRQYYWHRKSKEVSWTMPAEMSAALGAPQQPAAAPQPPQPQAAPQPPQLQQQQAVSAQAGSAAQLAHVPLPSAQQAQQPAAIAPPLQGQALAQLPAPQGQAPAQLPAPQSLTPAQPPMPQPHAEQQAPATPQQQAPATPQSANHESLPVPYGQQQVGQFGGTPQQVH